MVYSAAAIIMKIDITIPTTFDKFKHQFFTMAESIFVPYGRGTPSKNNGKTRAVMRHYHIKIV